jgi:hypothetical protein
MQIQLEVNMKKDFEALSKRFAGKSVFLRSSGPSLHAVDKVITQSHTHNHQSAATTPRIISVTSSKLSSTSRSQSAPRKQAFSQPTAETGREEEQQMQSSSALRERPQSSIPTGYRRKSVLQEMEEAYLKAASRFDVFETNEFMLQLLSVAQGRTSQGPTSSRSSRSSCFFFDSSRHWAAFSIRIVRCL